MMRTRDIIHFVARSEGILRLAPTFVHRFYPDFGRLGQKRLKRSARQFIPERWIGSSVQAVNPAPMPSGGVSMLADSPEPVSLPDALCAAAPVMLGRQVLAAHGPEFRVLVKLLDPGEPIVFHLHATDRQVKQLPRHFRGHRFGKDEAYYFLDGVPKGPMPYTHAGLYEGVTRKDLVQAVRRGPQHALELSPVLYQEYEAGFFVPAGVPHRPGTALTLEIQQPSDVYTLLETRAGGKEMPPQQIHPGFATLAEAFGLVDLAVSRQVGKLEHNRLTPQPIHGVRGGEVAWVFPLDICGKFGGHRIRVTSRVSYSLDMPLVLWVWRGRGTLNGRPIRAGEEMFVCRYTASAALELATTGDEPLECFTFFPSLSGVH
jgi:hypothetical protein